MTTMAHPPQPAAMATLGSSLTLGVNDSRRRRLYLAILAWSFALFSSVRILAYLPTLWAIHHSGDASQHSLWTWLTWFGSNLTMALWLYEHGGQRMGRAVAVNIGNAAMCVSVITLIAYYQW